MVRFAQAGRRHVATAALCATALSFPLMAQAHLVTGRVSGGGFKCNRDTLFVFLADSAVCTIRPSKSGEFARVLAPGRYRVEFRDRRGTLWIDEVIADDEPVHQDVHLRKARKSEDP
jgi:hypothetical protein